MSDKDFRLDQDEPKLKASRTRILKNGLIFRPSRYEYSDEFVPAKDPVKTPLEVHTTAEMIEALRGDPKIEIDARVLGVSSGGERQLVRMNRDQFLEAVNRRESKNSVNRSTRSSSTVTDRSAAARSVKTSRLYWVVHSINNSTIATTFA